MKKKLLLLTVLVMVFVCLFVISSSAATTPDPTRGTVTLDDDTVCALYDTEGDALIWYLSEANQDDGYAKYDFIKAQAPEVDYKGTQWSQYVYSARAYQTGAITITVNGTSYDKTKLVVLNLKDDDVLVTSQVNASNSIGYPVNCLEGALNGASNLEYAYMRTDFVAFQGNAFLSCSKLKYININELTELVNIAGSAFNGCKKLLDGQPMDLRNSKLAGIGSNALNGVPISALYLPETLVDLYSYALQCMPKVTYINIPSSLKTFSGDSMMNTCPELVTVEGFAELFERGVLTTTIPLRTFENCYKLQPVFKDNKIPEGVQTIGRNAFYKCYEVFGEELVLPNSLTTLGQGALTGAKNVKTVWVGANLTTLGGYDVFNGWTSLETIYFPAGVTTIPINTFCNSNNIKTIYFTGDEDQAITVRKSAETTTGNGVFVSSTLISWEKYQALPDKTGTYFIFDYNLCDAFYQGIHADTDKNCETAVNVVCTREGCGKDIAILSHKLAHTVVYKDGFLMAGVHTQYCTNAGCEAANKTEDLRPMFVADGYSYKTAGTTAGISVKYTINTYEYKLYQAHESKLSFGVIVANAEKIGADTFITDEGTLNALENKGIQVTLKSNDYSTLTCTVNGFTNEEKHLALKLVMSAYVYEVDENGNKTSDATYIQKVYTQKENETDPAYTAYADTIERDATLGVVTIGQVKAHDEYLLKQPQDN